MVHPTQQNSGFRRSARASISFARNGRVWSFAVRPGAAALALGVFAVVSTAYLGATVYLICRDDLLGGSLSRQVAMQYSYEDRIAALRGEIDRLSSRHGVEAKGVAAQLALLLERQSELASRQSDLDGLIGKARETGIDVAEVRPSAAPSHAKSPADVAVQTEAPLAYAPAENRADDPISGTLMRGAGADDIAPVLSRVEAGLDAAQTRQGAALDGLEAASRDKIDRISAALAPLGVESDAGGGDGPQGGPFISAGSLHFVERTTLLQHSLDELASLRNAARALPLRAPVAADRISSRFGYRNDPFLNRPALHAGIDFVAGEGTAVRATAPGIVISAGWSGGYGQMVEVQHASGVSTRYGHLSAILVKPGVRLTAGAVLGRVGSTGRSTGPHLHYETRRNGDPVDPAIYLAAGRKAL